MSTFLLETRFRITNIFNNLDQYARFKPSLRGRIEGLDELRGIAILCVLVAHGAALIPNAPIFLQGFGSLGVILFFFISGYLITRILIVYREKPDFFSTFYIRRILRIWPLMLLTLGISALLYPQTAHFYKFNLSLTNNYYYAVTGLTMERTDVMWSLAVEEHFYLFWPVIIYVTPRKYLNLVCLALVAVGFILSKGTFPFGEAAHVRMTHANIHYLALGCGLAASKSFFKQSLILLAALFVYWGFYNGFREPSNNMPIIVFNLLWLGAYVATSFAIEGSWKLQFKILALFGKLCYGLYLIHFFLTPPLLARFGRESLIGFPVFVISSLALAFLSYKYLEVPAQNPRHYLEKHQRAGYIFLIFFSSIIAVFFFKSVPF
jgi:peptidoglycan/LPS O-acetylase OafA/YrhL